VHDGIDLKHPEEDAPEVTKFVAGLAIGTAQGFGATIVDPMFVHSYSIASLQMRAPPCEVLGEEAPRIHRRRSV
jgi:hypothetical protein